MSQIVPWTNILCSYMAIETKKHSLKKYLPSKVVKTRVLTNQGTQSKWCYFGQQDRIARSVALEDLVGSDLFNLIGGYVGLFHLLDDFLSSLSLHQGFGLSQEVGQQDLVMQTASDWIVGVNGGDEIARNELRSLMNQLVECMLAIRAWLAPN